MDQELRDDIQRILSQLDGTWREWLFGALDGGVAIQRAWQAECCFVERLQGEDPDAAEDALRLKARVAPFVTAMISAIGGLRSGPLDPNNDFVRCREFYKYLPVTCLEFDLRSGVLAVPRPGPLSTPPPSP